MHLALQCFVIQRKKLEMREVNEKGNPSFFPFPVFCPLVFCCNLCDVIVLVTRVHGDYLARVLSVNCFKSKLKFLKCLQLSHTSMYVAVISRVSGFFFLFVRVTSWVSSEISLTSTPQIIHQLKACVTRLSN